MSNVVGLVTKRPNNLVTRSVNQVHLTSNTRHLTFAKSRCLELQLQPELQNAWASRTEERVAGRDVGRGASATKPAWA